jgi:cell division protein FtsL
MSEAKPLYIFFLFAALMFCLFFHVWASGSFKTLSFEITKTAQKKKQLIEDKRLLETEIARLKTPERIEKLSEILEFKSPETSQIELIK